MFNLFAVSINWFSENLVVLGNSFMDKNKVQIQIIEGSNMTELNAINNYWNTTDLVNRADKVLQISNMIWDKNDDLRSPGICIV